MRYLCELFVCIAFACIMLYKSIDNLNKLTELQLIIPLLANEVQEINERNLELFYQIESFENPQHLMTLAQQPHFQHLKFPSRDNVLIIPGYSHESTP